MSTLLRPGPIHVFYDTADGGGTPWTPPSPWTPETQHLTLLAPSLGSGSSGPACISGFGTTGVWVIGCSPTCSNITAIKRA